MRQTAFATYVHLLEYNPDEARDHGKWVSGGAVAGEMEQHLAKHSEHAKAAVEAMKQGDTKLAKQHSLLAQEHSDKMHALVTKVHAEANPKAPQEIDHDKVAKHTNATNQMVQDSIKEEMTYSKIHDHILNLAKDTTHPELRQVATNMGIAVPANESKGNIAKQIEELARRRKQTYQRNPI